MGLRVVAKGRAGRCPGRGRRDAEVRGRLGDPRAAQLGESSARPQRQAGAPGSPRAHRRQVGPGAVGCAGPRAPRAVGTVPGYCQATAPTHGDLRAPGTCQQGGRGRDPAPPRWATIAGSAGPAPTSPRRSTQGQLGVLGSGRHRSAYAGKVPRARWTSSLRLARVKDAKRPVAVWRGPGRREAPTPTLSAHSPSLLPGHTSLFRLKRLRFQAAIPPEDLKGQESVGMEFEGGQCQIEEP